MILDTTDPTLRTAWAIVCGYVPDSDEADAPDVEAAIAAAPPDWHVGNWYLVGSGDYPEGYSLAQMVEANAEDWHVLAWLASAEVGDVEDGYHSERMERVR